MALNQELMDLLTQKLLNMSVNTINLTIPMSTTIRFITI